MEDLPLQKITIPGPILASLLHRSSSSPGDSDGLLFGHVSLLSPSSLSDDLSPSPSSPSLVASITSSLSSGTTPSFFDSSGLLHPPSLHSLLRLSPNLRLLGWFSSRRRSPLRPSLRELSLSLSLLPSLPSPPILLLLSSPFPDPQTLIHTLDYRAYQLQPSSNTLVPLPLHLINIGPAFRGHYDSFSPNSDLPCLPSRARGSPMKEDGKEGDRLSHIKQLSKDQSQLNLYAEGQEIGSLTKLMGSEAAGYTAGLEDLYEKMLAKLDSLARLVESSSSKVLEQENCNVRLRYKAAGLE